MTEQINIAKQKVLKWEREISYELDSQYPNKMKIQSFQRQLRRAEKELLDALSA